MDYQCGKCEKSQMKLLLISSSKMFFILGLLWLFFYISYSQLKYIKTGHEIIYDAKVTDMCDSISFPQNAQYKIVVCGDSRILSGFIPNYFDSENTKICSYNFGLPNASKFLFTIERLIQRGQVPTHVFFTVEWAKMDGAILPSDGLIMKKLFPFKTLPRDLTLFFIRSRSRGGIAKYYQFGEDSVERMLTDRGYYFIEGQSHYPDHQLPDGYNERSDTPNLTFCRNYNTNDSTFKKMIELHERYNINFYIVPTYFRSGSKAQPPLRSDNANVFKGHPCLQVLGPEYFLFPNKYFSDRTHLNYEGARLYTKKLRAFFDEKMVAND